MVNWTREQTVERRAAWNAAIRSGEITGRDGKADMTKVAALQASIGFTADRLKDAVWQHDLDGKRAAYEASPEGQRAMLCRERERLSDAAEDAIERSDRSFARMHESEDARAWSVRAANEGAVADALAVRHEAIRAFDAAHPEIIAGITAEHDAEYARSYFARGLD